MKKVAKISNIKNRIKNNVPCLVKCYRVIFKYYRLTSRCIKKLYFKYLYRNPQKPMVDIGGGGKSTKGWSVLDFQCEHYRHKRILIDFWYDLTSFKKLPFSNDSVYLFYSEHTFEHIQDEECQFVFTEIYRCLKPEGGFRIVVPHMDLAYAKYGSRDINFFDYWMKQGKATFTEAFLILFAHPRTKVDDDKVRYNYENMDKEEFFAYYSKALNQDPKMAGQHINWFNFPKLEMMLEQAGFQEIYESDAQTSRFKEMRGKHFDTRPWWSIHVEAVKHWT